MKIWLTAGALMAALLFAGCKVSKPGSMETKVMNGLKHDVTIGGKNDKNPLQDNADNVKDGGEHFQHHCQICHGLDGQNTGVPFAQKMSPPVADLSSKDVQEYTDGQLKWIIQNGIGPSGMPGWKDILTDEEMWKMVIYIRHLPAKGSLGAPDIFKEEAEQHEEMEHQHGGAEQKGAQPHEHTHKH